MKKYSDIYLNKLLAFGVITLECYFFLRFIYVYVVCLYFTYKHACVPCFCMMPRKPEESVGSLETSVTEA